MQLMTFRRDRRDTWRVPVFSDDDRARTMVAMLADGWEHIATEPPVERKTSEPFRELSEWPGDEVSE